nr:twin-arginine translocase TatA/TatE family subunit [uncultured Bacteroides sp.]
MLNSILLWSVGFPEILVLALIVLLLFGGKKIPELMKGLGKGVKSFKDGIKEAENEIKNTKDELDKPSEEEKK